MLVTALQAIHLLRNAPSPPELAIATQFLQPFGILDLPYRTMQLETERGMVAFIPLLDGYPVIQEIGVDRGNIGWIDVKVNTAGQVTQVQYSRHDFQPVDDYPILTAQQAWERFTQDLSLQYSRYAVLSPQAANTYQSWVRTFQPGQQVDLYGWVQTLQPADSSYQALVTINDLPLIGDTSALIPINQYAVNFIHAWGQVQGSTTDGVALNLASWESSSLSEETITGTISVQAGQTQLQATDRTLALIDPPVNLPDGLQVSVLGVVLAGDPASLSWRYIESGEIPMVYGSSSSCGGTGSGGFGSAEANFGGGSFSATKIYDSSQPTPTPVAAPFQPGDEITGLAGTVNVTHHIYLGGTSRLEVYWIPDPNSGVNGDWGYSLVGGPLVGIDQYQNMPVRIWGKVEKIAGSMITVSVDRYEPVYPDSRIQAWVGTEQIVTLNGKNVVLLTTGDGNGYVLKSSIDWGADGAIIGRLGDVIQIEGYLMTDQQVGEYTVLKDTAGSAQVTGVAESAQVGTWDESQEPSSNPGAVLQGQVSIEQIELAYDATNLDRCQAALRDNPDFAPHLLVQPMWIFNGYFEDGRRFIVQVQALTSESLQP